MGARERGQPGIFILDFWEESKLKKEENMYYSITDAVGLSIKITLNGLNLGL
jgi:hypothetical protein